MNYHIFYAPEVIDKTRKPNGNGGKSGNPQRHLTKSINDGFLYGNGCLKHNSVNCFTCPRADKGKDCDYDFATEYILRKKLKCQPHQ